MSVFDLKIFGLAQEEPEAGTAEAEQYRELCEWHRELYNEKSIAAHAGVRDEPVIVPYEIVWREIKPSERDIKVSSGNAQSRSSVCDLSGHRRRVLERFSLTGLSGFSDHEILELLLFYTIPRRDTKQTGRVLMERFGSVWAALGADAAELVDIPFITPYTVRLFHLIRELSRLSMEDRAGELYDSLSQIRSLLAPHIRQQGTDSILIACFDSSLRLMDIRHIRCPEETFAKEGVRRAAVYLSGSSCAAAVTARYCPGYISASGDDMTFAASLSRLLSGMDIEYIDHMVYDGGSFISLRSSTDRGFLMGG